MSALELAMATLIGSFQKYAGSDGDSSTMTKAELKTMMEKELPGFMKGDKNQDPVSTMMEILDQNGDAKVDFLEYVSFVSSLAIQCHKNCPSKCPSKCPK